MHQDASRRGNPTDNGDHRRKRVYRCVECGVELQVDLVELASDDTSICAAPVSIVRDVAVSAGKVRSAMTISKYNAEGYYDPTKYAALINIEMEEKSARFRPLVYICSPYSGTWRAISPTLAVTVVLRWIAAIFHRRRTCSSRNSWMTLTKPSAIWRCS